MRVTSICLKQTDIIFSKRACEVAYFKPKHICFLNVSDRPLPDQAAHNGQSEKE